MIQKQNKYIEKTGITGTGDDYNIYKMSLKEKIIGFLIAFAGGFLGFQIIFGILIASLILGTVTGFLAYSLYGKFLFKKRQNLILIQFRDLLDALNNSFASGKNTQKAFEDSFNDMQTSSGEESIICKELKIILSGLQSNFTIEDLLKDMAIRCGLEDMQSFADTFAICNRIGGNLKAMVSEGRSIINDKIEIEMEIQTTLAANKNELNIMSVLPFIIILMMNMMGQDSITENSILNVAVKCAALIIFIVSYIIGRKITDIKV